jgi:hypothetical protein
LRLLFYLVIGYVVWKVIQVVVRGMSSSHRDGGNVFTKRPAQNTTDTFKDIKDADFEELPPDEKK